MRRKLIASYISILFLFSLFTYIFVLPTIYRMVRDNVIDTSGQTMNRWCTELSSVMDFGRTYILNISTNDSIQDALRELSDTTYSPRSTSAELEQARTLVEQSGILKKVMYANDVTMKNVPFLVEVCYRTSGGFYVPLYTSNRSNSSGTSFYSPNEEWIHSLEQRSGKFLWSTYHDSSNEYIRLSKVVYDTNDYSKIIGIISLDLSYVHIAQSVLNPLRQQYGIEAALMDMDTRQVIGYHSIRVSEDELSSMADGGSTLINNGKNCLFSCQLDNTDYYLVGLKSLDLVRTTYMKTCLMLMVGAGGTLVLGLFLTMILSHTIMKPVVRLSQTMKEVEYGDLDITVSTTEKGEIGELYSSFNYMIQMINTLIQENYVTRINQKQSELNALESQINTHFLYNTLDSINWMAKDHNAPDISYLVTNLSTLLRTSLNHGKNKLTVAQELTHARSYMNIQRVRFGDLFTVQEDIEPGILEDIVLKMLLQPLIENAILHAFGRSEAPDIKNVLTVSAKEDGEYLMFQVSNPGTHEDFAHIQDILNRVPDLPSTNYGINSIKNRLSIAYNHEAEYYYTLDNESILTASIRIPRRYTKFEGDAYELPSTDS